MYGYISSERSGKGGNTLQHHKNTAKNLENVEKMRSIQHLTSTEKISDTLNTVKIFFSL